MEFVGTGRNGGGLLRVGPLGVEGAELSPLLRVVCRAPGFFGCLFWICIINVWWLGIKARDRTTTRHRPQHCVQYTTL